MNNFFRDFNIRRGFNESPKSFLKESKTICIKFKDGKIIEHEGITNPWRYITAVKKNINVENAWIKNE